MAFIRYSSITIPLCDHSEVLEVSVFSPSTKEKNQYETNIFIIICQDSDNDKRIVRITIKI